MSVYVKQHIAIGISDVVPKTVLIVGHHVQTPGVENLVQVFNRFLALRARNCSPRRWFEWLIWKIQLLGNSLLRNFCSCNAGRRLRGCSDGTDRRKTSERPKAGRCSEKGSHNGVCPIGRTQAVLVYRSKTGIRKELISVWSNAGSKAVRPSYKTPVKLT